MLADCPRQADKAPGVTEVFAGPLAGGDHVVLFFNRNASAPTTVSVYWNDLGIAGGTKMKARDLWYRNRRISLAHGCSRLGVSALKVRGFSNMLCMCCSAGWRQGREGPVRDVQREFERGERAGARRAGLSAEQGRRRRGLGQQNGDGS